MAHMRNTTHAESTIAYDDDQMMLERSVCCSFRWRNYTSHQERNHHQSTRIINAPRTAPPSSVHPANENMIQAHRSNEWQTNMNESKPGSSVGRFLVASRTCSLSSSSATAPFFGLAEAPWELDLAPSELALWDVLIFGATVWGGEDPRMYPPALAPVSGLD